MKPVIILLFSVFVIGIGRSDESPSVRWSQTEMHIPWIKRGKLLYFDPGREVEKFTGFIDYYGNGGKILRITPESFDRVSLVKLEYPDGVDAGFIEKYACDLLTAFGLTEKYVDAKTKAHLLSEQSESDGNPIVLAAIEDLFDQPKASIDGNHWHLHFVTISSNWRVRLRFAEGQLKPFSIDKEYLLTLTGVRLPRFSGHRTSA